MKIPFYGVFLIIISSKYHEKLLSFFNIKIFKNIHEYK
jgi:hypothetical protein